MDQENREKTIKMKATMAIEMKSLAGNFTETKTIVTIIATAALVTVLMQFCVQFSLVPLSIACCAAFCFLVLNAPHDVEKKTRQWQLLFLHGFNSEAVSKKKIAGKLRRASLDQLEHRYTNALALIDEVLALDPEHPDALFMKAQILIHGFDDVSGACGYLARLVDRTGR